ncbi:MAG: single-stranded DNA-binding protein, partial [Mammaliicoccus vitulinus]
SNDLSSNFNKEKLRAKNTAKDNNENNINDEIYNQYSNVVKVMKEIEDSSNNENPSSNPKVPTS